MTKLSRIMIAFAALVMISLACNLGASRTSTPVPLETAAGDGSDLSDPGAFESLQGGEEVIVVLTEDQLTDLVDAALQNQSDAPIENPRITLQNGQIEFTGTTVDQPIQSEVRAIMTVHVDENGQPVFDLTSADLGPFPVPQAMLDEIESELDQALRAELQSMTAGMRIERITIADGEMTIEGRSN